MTTRILYAEDSVLTRKLVTDLLAAEPDLSVVATAPNGKIALEKIEMLDPDIVILDLEMPEMDGLETLRVIRRRWPDLPVLMFSALTYRAGEVTLDALAMGACDYVTKPTSLGRDPHGVDELRLALATKLRTLARHSREPETHLSSVQPPPPVSTRLTVQPIELVVIGASTGGPQALVEIMTKLPHDLPVPVLIAQHMPPMFTRLFAERLAGLGPLRVREGVSGERLTAGDAWIAPGDFHMSVVRDNAGLRVVLDQGPQENSCRPAADVLFRAAATTCGAGTLAVVLTGMGEDGLRGSRAVRAAGGNVVVQDHTTSVVWGMPGSVARDGMANEILPVDEIAGTIARRVAWSRRATSTRPS